MTDVTPTSSEAPSRKKRRRWPWIVVILLVIGGVWFVHRHRTTERVAAAKPPPARPVPITTATARKGDIAVYVEALGTVTPVYTVTIASRVQGQITQVSYEEGQLVHVGDRLVEIDPRPFKAALIQAKGQLAHDRGVLKQARIDLQRYRLAVVRNAISRQQLEDQEQIVVQDEGTVLMDEGTLANARVNLDYCSITSPIEGRVGLRLVDPGNMVQANSTTALVSIAQLQPITVIFSVAEDFLPQIQDPLKRGQRLAVDAFDRTQQKRLAAGSLLTLDNMIDTTTGTVRLRASFPNEELELFPNQFVNARLLVSTRKGVTLLPTAAIQRNAQGPYVYLLDGDQKASLHTIKTGTSEGNDTEVEGLNPGDVVAASGFDKLHDGAKTTVRKTAPTTGKSPPRGNEP